MELLVPAITIKAALAGLSALDMDAAELLARSGIAADQLDDPFGAVPNAVYEQLWTQAFLRDPRPTLPTRAAMAVPFGAFGLVDHLVNSASSIGEGLQMLALFLRLVASSVSLRFDHENGDWVQVVDDTDDAATAVTEQWTLAIVYQRFRSRMPSFAVDRVHLPVPQTAGAAEFAALWGAPVELGHRHASMRLSDGVWQAANSAADPVLHATLLTLAERVEIKQFEHAPLAYVIRTRLPEALRAQRFTADDMAQELGLSRRTLHRHLAAENATFEELLDMFRQEQAVQMLQSGDHSMVEIAYALGYNEQSSFNRAFRRWTGTSPSLWLRTQPASGNDDDKRKTHPHEQE